mmetsp:Transcript_56353/g.122501  ORF Transcript_56353/g.122501 Transcript_56353/m.122501 type:complete len:152 (+) Transcript_56353:794-1249(+)
MAGLGDGTKCTRPAPALVLCATVVPKRRSRLQSPVPNHTDETLLVHRAALTHDDQFMLDHYLEWSRAADLFEARALHCCQQRRRILRACFQGDVEKHINNLCRSLCIGEAGRPMPGDWHILKNAAELLQLILLDGSFSIAATVHRPGHLRT